MVRIPTHAPPAHAGEILLEEFLEPHGISQAKLAEMIGVTVNRVNEIIKGKRGMCPDTAIRLEALFGASAQFWLNLQLAWDLYRAQRAPEVEEVRKRIKRVPVNARFDKRRATALIRLPKPSRTTP
jgi:addiction module HigA family antidote